MKNLHIGMCIAAVLLCCLPLLLFSQNKRKEYHATIFTTAENTNLRITREATLQFHKALQPVEK